MSRPLRMAVVTGGHPFDVPGFHQLVQAISGSTVEPFLQHLDDLGWADDATLASYEVALFYYMPAGAPEDAPGTPHGRPRHALETLLAQGAGLVVLHHALLAYPAWDTWDGVVGARQRAVFTYHPDQEVGCTPASDHPITRGLTPWTMRDETYTMAAPEGDPVLGTQHPRSMPTLGWTRRHARSRVVCLQPGHDGQAWRHPSFVRLLAQGVRWAARPALA